MELHLEPRPKNCMSVASRSAKRVQQSRQEQPRMMTEAQKDRQGQRQREKELATEKEIAEQDRRDRIKKRKLKAREADRAMLSFGEPMDMVEEEG